MVTLLINSNLFTLNTLFNHSMNNSKAKYGKILEICKRFPQKSEMTSTLIKHFNKKETNKLLVRDTYN